MASPLPPMIGSSPFPFPFPAISPFPTNPPSNPPFPALAQSTTGPSPLPFSIPSNPPSNPFSGPFAFTNSAAAPGGTGGPGSSPYLGLTPFTQSLAPFSGNITNANTNTNPNIGVQDVNGTLGRGSGGTEWTQLNEGLKVVEGGIDRALGLLQEMKRLEEGLFVELPGGKDGQSGSGTNGRSEGMQVGLGGLSRLELLHLEYTQLLHSLIAISTSSLVSSLPSSFPLPSSNDTTGSGVVDLNGTSSNLDGLIAFAEAKANLEFNRKEAVKTSAKTVLDVLMKR